jgi:hypothetical protein
MDRIASSTLRQARSASIRDAALVRQHLGQAAQHQLADGRHQITFRGRTFTSATLAAAIAAAQEGTQCTS